jgi:diguanylate cyclase (GGDEF)-like protein
MVVLIPVRVHEHQRRTGGDSRNRDLKDIELLRGIGNAIGLSMENLRQKEEIQAKEHRLRAVITAAPIVLMNTDANGVFTLLEGRGLDRLQIAPQAVVGRSVFEVFRGMPDVVGQFQRALAGEVVTVVAEIGDTTFEAELCPVGDGASHSGGGVIGVATDVTERKRAEETVRHMAYHDSLTGLPNRELFENKLVESLAIAKKCRSSLAVVFLDLDGFKHVNDKIGHAEGDRLLREVAQQLTDLIREGDTVARIGGDEFLVLLPNVGGTGEAEAVCERILNGIRRDWPVESHRFQISGSLGIAVFPGDGADADALIREADRAMYRAKDGQARSLLAGSDCRLRPTRSTRAGGAKSLITRLNVAIVPGLGYSLGRAPVRFFVERGQAAVHVCQRTPDDQRDPVDRRFLPRTQEALSDLQGNAVVSILRGLPCHGPDGIRSTQGVPDLIAELPLVWE